MEQFIFISISTDKVVKIFQLLTTAYNLRVWPSAELSGQYNIGNSTTLQTGSALSLSHYDTTRAWFSVARTGSQTLLSDFIYLLLLDLKTEQRRIAIQRWPTNTMLLYKLDN